LSEHVEDTDGALVFRQACVMGLEGIVAKRRDSRYRSGRCREWFKVKNRAHPAFERAMLIALSAVRTMTARPGRRPPVSSARA
jgi:ATP-dependent DNA ligase